MSDAAHEKQHAATEHRLQQAGRDGSFARSKQLSSLIFIGGAGLVLWSTGGGIVEQVIETTKSSLGQAPDISGATSPNQHSIQLWKLANTLAPTLMMLGCVAWLSHAWQSGFKFFPEKLSLDFSRVHPSKGLGRMFSMHSLIGGIGGMFRLLLILAAGMLLLWTMRDRLALISFAPHGMLQSEAFEIAIKVVGGVMAIMGLLAMVDWLYQSKRHQDQLRLTDQEFRDEMKSIEGDPQVKMRQRASHSELMQTRNDLMATRAANIVLYSRNGDVAAIRYDSDLNTAQLIASANGIAGQNMLRAARNDSVSTMANDRAVITIVATVETGKTIPDNLWASIQQR